MEELIEKVIEQIRDDLRNREEAAVAELLRFVPEENLKGYLEDV